MSTFAQLKTRIADDIKRSDLATQIGVAINRAIIHYAKERFFFNESSGTFSTVAGQESYGSADSIPSTIAEIDEVTLTQTSTNIYPLIKTSFGSIRGLNAGGTTSTGVPVNYAYYQEKFWLYPIPDAVYTTTVYFKKTYAALSADGDTNDFTEEAEDLIEARARWWIYKRVIRNKEDAYEAKTEEIEALSALQSKTTMLISTGSVRKNYL
jgi:hypothetical protein